MKPLSRALAAWEPGASIVEDPVSIVRSDWVAIVGKDVAANSRPDQITHDSLLVITRSSAWSQQLAFLSEPIIDMLRSRTGITLARLRFRVGRLSAANVPSPRKRRPQRKPAGEMREATDSLQAAFERFQGDVTAVQRAKERAGWKECTRCGVRVHPSAGPVCTPCKNAAVQERDARVARLLFEAPWLGYAGVAALVVDLTPQEYETVRLRLLRRWKDALERIRRMGGSQLTARDRMIASSYVLLKSQLDPERIAPAVVRDLLGDELHDMLYGSEND